MLKDYSNCCGCRACEYICPTNAISFSIHDDTFMYPEVDTLKCIKCNKCELICDWKNKKEKDCNVISAYGFKHKENSVLKNSTSGGTFTALSDYVLENNGVIFGAVMHDDFSVCYEVASNKTDRNKMRGSKYVQCDMKDVFKNIKIYLDSGKLVLFVGTPCQVASVKNVFKKEYDNLVLVDFLCHGVNSNKMLIDHIKWLEIKYNHEIAIYEFRPKDLTWTSSAAAITFKGKKNKEFIIDTQQLYRLFSSNTLLRPSCYNCRYRTEHRYSDMTIADFWGYEEFYPNTDKTGLSLIFINSDVGNMIFKQIEYCGEVVKVPYFKIRHRIPLIPPKKSEWNDMFMEEYKNNGYESSLLKFFPISTKRRFRFLIKKLIRGYEAKRNNMV